MTVSNSSLQILGADNVLAQLRTLRSRRPVKYWAFYSSQLRGIVTDPALMVIPFDDHMGRSGDWRRQARERHQGAPPASRGGHA